jgi:hypothetical protein
LTPEAAAAVATAVVAKKIRKKMRKALGRQLAEWAILVVTPLAPYR